MSKLLDFNLDRTGKVSLADQIFLGITAAIDRGVLVPGARLPSWLDLAAQLGVARGTVKTAYERLADSQQVLSSRPGGTRVVGRSPRAAVLEPSGDKVPLPELCQEFSTTTAIFQNGVPASDRFPAMLFARLRAQATRAEMSSPLLYPDPQGELELRREVAAHLALARGIKCNPAQVFITSGFTGGLGLALGVLKAEGRRAWVESPGFPPSRRALELTGVTPVPVPVDPQGMDVARGLEDAPEAAFALVTACQQAPTGVPLSLARRVELLDWATRTGAWIIEDDYLGELQLKRRATPALASLDSTGRVIHIGSFSKTLSPTLRLGYLVAPAALTAPLAEAALCLAPAPGPAVQLATAEFMKDGHYLRHLRRMKRVYAARSQALQASMRDLGYDAHIAGLAVLLGLPEAARDRIIAREAASLGLAPAPLSPWFAPGTAPRPGLLLGLASADEAKIPAACERLHQVIRRFT